MAIDMRKTINDQEDATASADASPDVDADAQAAADAESESPETAGEQGRAETIRRLRAWRSAGAERARATYEVQRANVSRRVHDWYATDDISNAQLAAHVASRRASAHHHREAELVRSMTRIKVQLAQAEARAGQGEAGASLGAVERLGRDLAMAEARLDAHRQTQTQDLPATANELTRARWARKAGRGALTLAAALGWLKGVSVEPMVLLGTAGAIPAGWWWLARPYEPEEAPDATEAEAAGAHRRVDLVKHSPASAMAAAAMNVPVQEVPGQAAVSPLGAAARVDPVQVQGAQDLITALVKAKVIEAGDREETSVIGLIQKDGPGWKATVELPPGQTSSEAIGKIEQIASALRVKAGQIELFADTSEEGHEGRFTIWVADADNPFGTANTPSELAAAEVWDFWANGVPLGLDARQTRQVLDMLWSSLLIGGLQGYGKSYLARLIAAAAALDPYVRIILITGKAGPDWAALKKVAHAYIAGASPDKLNQVQALLDTTITDMQQRGERLERLYETNPETCPEGKVTAALAREPGTELTLMVVDELQELLDAAAMTKVKVGDEEEGGGRGRSGKDVLVEKFARFVRVTRFVGGMGVFITQRPDSGSVPTALREVCIKRASTRVKGGKSAKMVLGDEAVGAGAAPHMLREIHRGVYVVDQGAESGHLTIKGDTIDLPAFGRIAERGRQLRLKTGTLSGYAVEHGQAAEVASAVQTLLSDCLTVLDKAGLDRARTERLVELLADYYPGSYGDGGLTTAGLQARLRESGAGTTRKLGPTDGMANPNGYYREQIAAAQTGK
ncbi:hypothetical protein ACFU99_34940 [Streptomyces sp. NPDC057654]|uniref:hypothetical protein n=1 Tax=Streptomyces sp. NPDC057654 TaxID=3346196 RepID=UPI0036A24F72